MSATAWYFARSAGLVAYLLLCASVAVGALMTARSPFAWPRFAVEEVHRFLAILTGVFVVLHGGTLLLDRVVPISLGQELVPFTSSYRPFAVGLGVTTAELLAAVGISNHYRRRLPYALWRRIHYLTLVAWPLATLHVILSGSDRSTPWFAACVAGAFSAAALAIGARAAARTASA